MACPKGYTWIHDVQGKGATENMVLAVLHGGFRTRQQACAAHHEAWSALNMKSRRTRHR